MSEALPPIRAERTHLELRDEHAHEVRNGNLTSDQVMLIQLNALSRHCINLYIEECRSVKVREIWTHAARLPVIDEKFALKMIQQSILLREGDN